MTDASDNLLPRRVYLDNAATSFPKPPEVMAAMCDYAQRLGANAGRGAYQEAIDTGQLLAECRGEIRQLINGHDDRHIIFTLNCTDALNLALRGLIDPFNPGHAICTAADHNSILRPLHAMAGDWKLALSILPVDPVNGRIDPDALRRALRPDTRLVSITHASNVTGAVQPLGDISRICREAGVPLVVDAAQSVGHVPVDVQADGIDLLAAPGHKGLLGPLGTGFLYIRPGLEQALRPMRQGGTGSRSSDPDQPAELPDRFESGSHNAIGLAGLLAGVKWVRQRGLKAISEHEQRLGRLLMEGLAGLAGVRCYGPDAAAERTGVFSIRIDGYGPQELSAALESGFGILTRSGLHCAPLMHGTLGTLDSGGTTRLSLGPFVTEQDIGKVLEALTALAGADSASARPRCF